MNDDYNNYAIEMLELGFDVELIKAAWTKCNGKKDLMI